MNNFSLIAGLAVAAGVAYIFLGPRDKKRQRKKENCPGLINHGSTCFLNALLQSLAPCSTFVQWLQEIANRHSLPSYKSFTSTVYKVLRVLNNVDEVDDEDVYSPHEVFDALKAKHWVIPADEQDAHELFHVVTETLDEELSHQISIGVSLFDVDGVVNSEMCSGVTRISSPLPQLSGRDLHPFRGLLVSQLQCQHCGHKCPLKYDTFDSLSLSIPPFQPQLGQLTLDMLLRKFVRSERVENVICESCNAETTVLQSERSDDAQKTKSTFWKKLSLGKLPRCLCIHLQRTVWLESGLPMKRSEHIVYPELLDLTDYMYMTMKVKRRLTVTESGLVGGRHFDNPSRPVSVTKPYPSSVNLLKAHNYEHRVSSNGLQMTSSGDSSLRTQALANVYSRDIPAGAPKGGYRLVSVIVHHGGVLSGHFVTYRRAPPANGQQFSSSWLYTSDTSVHQVALADVLAAPAYMLFYEKL